DTAGSLVALASPYLNQKIHEMTAGDTAKDKAANLMAHALLSAVEFQVTGKDPLTGAIAGVTGEATAEIIARAYGKPVSELTANEKENISTLSQLAGGLAAALTAKANGTTAEQGGNFLAATSGAETAKRAVENNYLSIADVQNFIRELSKAQKEGRDTKPILEKYKGISEENRQQLIACKGNVACETAHLHEMNTGAEELERNLGFFSRMTVYYPNDLNTANRTALFNLVESENAESFSKLSDTTKFGLNAMEAGTAIGLGAAAGYAKVGFSNVKSLISGKNKAYPTSEGDGYKHANVGDSDYRSSGASNAYVDPRTEKLKSVLPTGRQMLDPSEVSFSQATVSYQKKGKDYNYDTMVEDMRKNGWNGKPVDVVNMPDNAPTSMDNTRILAAREAGIKVEANVHSFNEKLTAREVERFQVNGVFPNTWGEAILLRIEKQGTIKGDGIPNNWNIKYPHGSIYDPKVQK
uniref:VENN motif pre-toxin domain-containing protein n=1 Tax=Aggregatibacter segnis TaxID=739 RepID=UPI0013A548AC